jgi:type IV pilus biogenesis protein PilP
MSKSLNKLKLNKKSVLLSFFACALPYTAFGATANTGQLSDIMAQAAIVQAQDVLLAKQLKGAKLQQELKLVKEGKSSKQSTTSPQGFQPVSPMGMSPMSPMNLQPSSAKHHSHSPQVLSLMGTRGKYTAELAMPDGSIVDAVSGTNLGRGWAVKSVTSSGVVALHKGRLAPLAFSGRPSGSGSQGANAGAFTPSSSPMSFAPPMTQGIPQGIPQGMPRNIPQGMPSFGTTPPVMPKQ